MNYRSGDQVVHWTHGSGKIIAIEEKQLAGQTRQYYVLEMGRMTLWVPVDEAGESSLRLLSSPSEFAALLELLRCPGEPMSAYAYQRRAELNQRMKRKTLAEICLVIRDLATLSHVQRLNMNDHAIFKRAKAFLLDEWERSLGTPRDKAQYELERLLEND
jgi:CarD family transcriptional regulator